MKDIIYVMIIIMLFALYTSEKLISDSRQSQIEIMLKQERFREIREVHRYYKTIDNFFGGLTK